ncbi:hypothetical protein ACIREE_15150 [Streptomyces sp. NPDC102467]|uniref:hypothetical protein n=1 Tax=Streptomyces sp. NPDC102467 TaxID=3366179 RepID=UPI0037F1B1EE
MTAVRGPGRAGEHTAVHLSVPGAQVHLTGPARLVSGAAARLAPFVASSEPGLLDQPGNTWSIQHPTEARTDTAELEHVTITAATEPTATLAVDHERRRLILDPACTLEFATHLAARYARILLRLQRATRAQELFLHAGMAASAPGAGEADRGIAVIGPKRAGKTSTVMAAMRAGAAFVGNDDLSVTRSPDGWTGHGWPRSVSVRSDTFTALGISPPERSAHPGRPPRPQEPAAGAAPVMLLPSELASLLGAPGVRPSAPLTALVFPRFAPDAGDTALRELTPDETAQRLRREQPVHVVKQADFLLPHFPRPSPAETEEVWRALVTDVPGFELAQSFTGLTVGARRLKSLWS